MGEHRMRFGGAQGRREDDALITGKGRFTDDVSVEGQAYAAFVRSPVGHANLHKIDAAAARPSRSRARSLSHCSLSRIRVIQRDINWEVPVSWPVRERA